MSVTVAKAQSNGVYETPEKAAMQIYKTKNYDQFLFLAGNREVNDRHVQKLMTSMSEEECLRPDMKLALMAQLQVRKNINTLMGEKLI